MKRKTFKILAGTFAVTACIALTGGLATEKTAYAAETAYSTDTLQLSMIEGASVRIAETSGDAGIRFSMTLPKAEYEWLIASAEGETAEFSEVTFGMFVAPYAYHKRHALNEEANVLGENRLYGWLKGDETNWETSEDGTSEKTLAQIINIEGNNMFEDTKLGAMRFNGAVVNMLEENFTKEYVGVGYIRYTTVETAETPAETHYVFATENDNVRSITYVAQCAVADTLEETKPTDEEKTFLNKAYINVSSVLETASEYYIDYYLRGADGTYVKDEALTQTVSSTVNAKVNDIYNRLKTVNGYIFNENFNTQLKEFTVYANNKTPHVRVNLENGTIADFEEASDIWVMYGETSKALDANTWMKDEYGTMLKQSMEANWQAAVFNKWTKDQLLRASAAGYTYLKLDVCYFNPEKSDAAWVTVCGTSPLYVATNTMTTLSVELSKITDNAIGFNITNQKDYDIYVDNIRFGTDTSPTTDVTYLYNGFEALTVPGNSLANLQGTTRTFTSKDGSQVVQVEAQTNGTFALVNPAVGGWHWSALYEQYAGKTLKFKIYLEKDSWVNVGHPGNMINRLYTATGGWIEISTSIDALKEKVSSAGTDDYLCIQINAAQTCYVDDFKIV